MSCEPEGPVRGIFTLDIFDESFFLPHFFKCIFKSTIYHSVLIPVRQDDVGISLEIGDDVVDVETGFVGASPDFSPSEHNYNEMRRYSPQSTEYYLP